MKVGSWTTLLLSVLVVVFASATQGVAQVEISTAESDYGTHLVDSEGRSLYLFLLDDAMLSACSDDCAEAWPPVLAEGEVTAGEGVDASLLSTVARTDGGRQVTYGGWPLYRYAQDGEPGATEGQGGGFAWYLVSPEAEALTTPVSEPTEDGEDGPEAESGAGETPAEGDAQAAAGGEADVAANGELFQALMNEGEDVFASTCAGCHGEEGDEALATHVAILAGNERAVENAGRVVRRVLYGGTYMPAFGDALSDRQVAAVATYVRNSWGNDYGLVTAEEVSEQR